MVLPLITINFNNRITNQLGMVCSPVIWSGAQRETNFMTPPHQPSAYDGYSAIRCPQTWLENGLKMELDSLW